MTIVLSTVADRLIVDIQPSYTYGTNQRSTETRQENTGLAE